MSGSLPEPEPPPAVPDEPGPHHFRICEKTVAWLEVRVEGNGLKSDQVRLASQDTSVYRLSGTLTVRLTPEIRTNQVNGNLPEGEVLGSKDIILNKIEGFAGEFMKSPEIEREIRDLIEADTGKGWAMEDRKVPLEQTKKVFSLIDRCLKCEGEGSTPCADCLATGSVSCPICFGTGLYTKQDSSQQPCMKCQGRGKASCLSCGGQGRLGCIQCNSSGWWTHIWEAVYAVEFHFELDRAAIAPEVVEVVTLLGERALATEGHAEIFRLDSLRTGQVVSFPYTAFLPVARAEFSIEGRRVPAVAAGLHGRIVEIDAFLDKFIKPGIEALIRLSKGPLAVEALVGTACKYRILRTALSDVTAHTKRAAYQHILKEYPRVVSDKYARAIVKFSDQALLTLGRGPRAVGMIAGSLFSVLLSAAWYFELRSLALPQLGANIVAADIGAWALGWLAAFFAIKIMAAQKLKSLLPPELHLEKQVLPRAGEQGYYALVTTFIPWAAFAVFTKAEWLLQIVQQVHR